MHPDSIRPLRGACGALILALAMQACSPKVVAPPEPPPSVQQGDDAFHYADYPAAIQAYRTYLDQVNRGEYTARVLYKTALAEYRLKRYHDTLHTLAELAKRYPKTHWVQVDALRGDAYRKLGQKITALQSWGEAWGIANDDDRSKLRVRILSVARTLNSSELAEAQHLVDSQAVSQLLGEQIALRHAKPTHTHKSAGKTQPPETASRTSTPVAIPHTAQLQPQRQATPPAQPALQRMKVGCLLPLTGSQRTRGEQARQGLQLVFGPSNDRLVVEDTASNPSRAASAFATLARNPRVLVVIGPLGGDEAKAVAPLADSDQLPVLPLSARNGLRGPFVLQTGLTPSRQVAPLLAYAMTRVHLRRFGVLYPDDPHGHQLLSVFRAEVGRRGGAVIGTAVYSPRHLPRAEAVLKHWHDTDNLQALFVPASAQAVAPLAAFVQQKMPDVMLLGVQGWEALADHGAGTPLNGVVFADGFYADSGRPETRDFVDHFAATYGKAPGRGAAEAYDIGMLVKRVLDGGVDARPDVLKRLQNMGSTEGASGPVRVTPAGIHHGVFLLQLLDGRLQEIPSVS